VLLSDCGHKPLSKAVSFTKEIQKRDLNLVHCKTCLCRNSSKARVVCGASAPGQFMII